MRDSREIRRALDARRDGIVRDLSTLSERFDQALDVRRLARRHPLLTIAAGGVLGVLVVRRPGFLLRTARQLMGLGTPLVISAVARRLSRPAG